jgi:hypothetical protein
LRTCSSAAALLDSLFEQPTMPTVLTTGVLADNSLEKRSKVKVFPIRVPRKQYRGSSDFLRRRTVEHNQCAVRIEQYLNDRIATDPNSIQTYTYEFITLDLDLTAEQVREILFSVDCGHNGLTVAKSSVKWPRS